MEYNQLIANSNTAFGSGQFDTALDYAKKAIDLKPQQIDGYNCAGKACMSLDKPAEATRYFKEAIKIDENNGNLYFLLGYSKVLSGELSEALQGLTRAIEKGCDNVLKGQIYKMMSMINTDQGDYNNALGNLKQASEYMDLDYELLKDEAACYAALKEYKECVFTLNQMKMLQPRDYTAYGLAFHIFMELEIYDEALAELERAEKYADLTMAYYNDRAAYALLHDPEDDTKDNIREKWRKTLRAIDDGLVKGKPTAEQAFELYLRAAQLYMSLETPEIAVKILDAAANPISSYNNGFSILINEKGTIDSSDIPSDELSAEDEEAVMQEKWDNGEFDDITEEVNEALLENGSDDSAEIAEEVHKYLSPVDIIPDATSAEAERYMITGEFKMEPLQYDMRNSMYIAAYELMQDYDSMLKKARELQSSSILANQYSGIYYELKVGKYTNKDNWQKKYRERINYWTKRMLEDPMDYISASYRIRSYIDIGDFENAEQLCACLPTEVKEPLMEEIRKEKDAGGGKVGNIS